MKSNIPPTPVEASGRGRSALSKIAEKMLLPRGERESPVDMPLPPDASQEELDAYSDFGSCWMK